MMSNIFNQFDPSNSMTNPTIITLALLLLSNLTEKKPSPIHTTKMFPLTNLMKENSNNMKPNKKKMSNPMLLNITIMISIINMMALNPYSYSITSQLANNIPLIMSLWAPILIMILTNKKKKFITHLIPQSTPYPLIPLMFIIEITSFLIRPLTLMMRLTANMIAGHILIYLSSNLVMNTPMVSTLPSASLFILTMMEMIVAILQAYIIMTLLSMFTSEI